MPWGKQQTTAVDQERERAAIAANPQKYEYKATTSNILSGVHKQLAEMPVKGWELCQSYSETSVSVLIWKRELVHAI